MEFLEQDSLYPILCGYFNKIMVSLITKQKKNFFEYLFLHCKSDLFDMLLTHIQHHSLGQLLLEMLQVSSIYGGPRKELTEPDEEAVEINGKNTSEET